MERLSEDTGRKKNNIDLVSYLILGEINFSDYSKVLTQSTHVAQLSLQKEQDKWLSTDVIARTQEL